MSTDEDENHIITEIIHEIQSDSDYDTKTIPKRYSKIQAVLNAAKQDAIARGQLPVVKRLQSILGTLPDAGFNYNVHTNPILDNKNKKKTFHPASQLNLKRTPRYSSKESKPNFDSKISRPRYYRPKTALQYNNNRKRSSTKPNSNDNSDADDFVSVDFDRDFNYNTQNFSSAPTEKVQTINKTRPKKRIYTDEQLDVALENMVSGHSFIPETDVLPELIDYAKRKIDTLINNGELIGAQKYEDVYRQMQSSRLAWEECNSKTSKLIELTVRMNKTDKNLKNAEERMQKELSDYDERMKEIREAQIQEFEKKLQDFDEETNFRTIEKYEDEQSNSNLSTSRNSTEQSNSQISSRNSTEQSNSQTSSRNTSSKIYPNLPPSFRKFSQRLLDLRNKEKLLLKTRRFEEAGYTRIEADNIEAYEIVQCKNNYIRSREDKRAKLVEEQNLKMKCFEENIERTRKRLQNENETKILALNRAKENFQSRIDRLNGEIKDVLSITPAPSPLQTSPMSPNKSLDQLQSSPTFMTQNQQAYLKQQKNQKNLVNNDAKIKKKPANTSTMATPHIVYRPIPSKWRLQTPVVLKVHK